MRVSRGILVASCIAIPLVVLVASRRGPAGDVGPATAVAGWRPECPRYGEWTAFFDSAKNSPISHSGELALPGPLTNVPEFHDCQRFINDNGGRPLYMSLNAIFARDSLAELTAPLDSVGERAPAEKPSRTRIDSATIRGSGRVGRAVALGAASGSMKAIAVAEIMALDSGYAPLGIAQGFSCLYLYPRTGTKSGLEARMVPVGQNDSLCLKPLAIGSSIGTTLEVQRTWFPTTAVPPVARWDWDAKHEQQYMGVACGHAYCEVGKRGFVASHVHNTAKPVFAVKGWYDEQRLAYPARGATLATMPRVGAIVGTLVPAANLGTHNGTPDSSDFTRNWVSVATAFITDTSAKYLRKLNLEPSKVGLEAGNEVSLCYGDRSTCVHNNPVASATCTPPSGIAPVIQQGAPALAIDPTASRWWARIKSVKSQREVYYCVVQRQHPHVHIPGVVRWRWATSDETMWVRCLEGCCEVEAGPA